MNPTISDLRQRPEFFDTVADRIWRAWWEPHGVPLEYISGRLKENLAGGPMPRAFVAHFDGVFAGTASIIASDLDERPQYTPWVAAVWIEPQFRSRQIGRQLVEHAVGYALGAGIPRVYLTARSGTCSSRFSSGSRAPTHPAARKTCPGSLDLAARPWLIARHEHRRPQHPSLVAHLLNEVAVRFSVFQSSKAAIAVRRPLFVCPVWRSSGQFCKRTP
jgi:GNAT superfamily N-acetyltransferase